MGWSGNPAARPEAAEDAGLPWASVLPALASVMLWGVASSSIILLNKYLISQHGFRAPMLLASLGQLTSSVVTFVLCRLLRVVPTPNAHKVDLTVYLKYIIPAAACQAANLSTSNYTFVYLPVTYIQMLKSLSPALNFLVLVLLDMEKPNVKLCASVALIVVGTAIASNAETAFSAIGFSLYLGGELFEISRVVIIQIMAQKLSFSPVEGLFYMTPIAFAWLALAIVVFEREVIVREQLLSMIVEYPLVFAAAGLLGLAVNGATWAVIKFTSSLSLKVVATVKNALIVYLGHLLFHEAVSLQQVVGYGGSLLGFVLYSVTKAQLAAEQRKPKQHADRAETLSMALPPVEAQPSQTSTV